MSLNTLLDIVLGPPKDYDILDRDVYSALEQHSKDGALYYHGQTGEAVKSEWSDVTSELSQGPGELQIGEEIISFEKGLGAFPRESNMCLGVIRDIDGSRYTAFYFEPLRQASVVEETDSKKFLSSPYVIGETVEFENLEAGQTHYTSAEMRRPADDLSEEFSRPETHTMP